MKCDWNQRVLDTMGAAYLIELIRKNTASKEELGIIKRCLSHKIDDSDVRIEGDKLYIKDEWITLPNWELVEFTDEEIKKMFDNN